MNDELERVTGWLEREAQECARLDVAQWGEVRRAYFVIEEMMSLGVITLSAHGEYRWAAGLQSRLIDVKRQAFRHLAAMRLRHVEASKGPQE